jgi:hypothetical protein
MIRQTASSPGTQLLTLLVRFAIGLMQVAVTNHLASWTVQRSGWLPCDAPATRHYRLAGPSEKSMMGKRPQTVDDLLAWCQQVDNQIRNQLLTKGDSFSLTNRATGVLEKLGQYSLALLSAKNAKLLANNSLDRICWDSQGTLLHECLDKVQECISMCEEHIATKEVRPNSSNVQSNPVLDIDKEKQASTHQSAARPSVSLCRINKQATVLNKPKPKLSDRECDVVQALLNAGERGLSKDDLDKKSGHSDARKVLKALRESDSDWATVIQMPGKPGQGGYRIK